MGKPGILLPQFWPPGHHEPASNVFDHYTAIFKRRAASYHEAMRQSPSARRDEFQQAVRLLDLREGLRLIDAPSGGAYLRPFLPPGSIDLISVETSSTFASHARQQSEQNIILCDNLDQISLPTAYADRMLSLAGVHHLDDKRGFYHEACRLLKPAGLFCLADVAAGTAVDLFLNGFVDQYCSTGHQGVFLGSETPGDLKTCGFRILHDQIHPFEWHFADPHHMTRWCSLLFGLEDADHGTILDGITSILGCHGDIHGCHLHWSLRYLLCVKD